MILVQVLKSPTIRRALVTQIVSVVTFLLYSTTCTTHNSTNPPPPHIHNTQLSTLALPPLFPQPQYIANLRKSIIDGHKHNLTMVSDASPGSTKIMHSYGSCVFQLCMQTGLVLETSPSDHYWRRYEVGQWLVFGWFWGWGTWDTRLAREKLG